MRKLLFILLIMLPGLLFGQKKRFPKPLPQPPTEKEFLLAKKHAQCLNSHKYSAKERLNFTPFNKAATVKLISFDVDNEPNEPIYNNDGKYLSGDTTKRDTVRVLTPMAKENFALNFRKVKEIKTLTIADINALTDIMYNIGETPVKGNFLSIADPGASCYNPRNAILFIDKKGAITHYIEICFECGRYYFSSSKMRSMLPCEQKLNLLKKYFLARGIKKGTISER